MKRFEQLIHAIRIGVIAMATVTSPALSSTPTAAENNDTAIRPFRVNVPEADLTDLRRRLETWGALVDLRFNQDTGNEEFKKASDGPIGELTSALARAWAAAGVDESVGDVTVAMAMTPILIARISCSNRFMRPPSSSIRPDVSNWIH